MKKDIKNEVYNDWTLKKCLVPQYVELKMENFMELFESADGKEQEIGDGIMTVLSTKKYDNLYKNNFINFYKENGNNVVDAVESTLKTMAKIDDTISEQFDIVKICLN